MRASLLLLLTLLAVPASAQTKTGTTIGQFLLMEPSARVAAMGGAGVASYGEIQSLYSNPAALGHLDRSGAQFTRMDYLADISYNHAVAAFRFGGANTAALSLTYLDSGEMDVRTIEQPQGTGERFTVANLSLGLSLSRRITDRFAAGVQASYVRETVWHSSLDAVSLNFGVLYRLPFGPYLGASLSNFGTRGRYDGRDLRIRFDPDPNQYGDNSALPAALTTEEFPLPILFRVGLGWPIEIGSQNTVRFAVDANQPSDNTSSMSLGAEYSFREIVALRGGYSHLFQQDSEKGLTLGGGLAYGIGPSRLSFDYSWAKHQRLGDMQRFTLGVTF